MAIIVVRIDRVTIVQQETEIETVCPGCGHDFASIDDDDGVRAHGYIGTSQDATIVGDHLDYGGGGYEDDSSGATDVTTGYQCRHCGHMLAGELA